MNDRLAEALEYISDKHIAEAASMRRRHRRKVLRTIAAILTIALLFNMPHIPGMVMAKEVAAASGSRAMERPDIDKYEDREEFSAALDAYINYNHTQQAAAEDAVAKLSGFFGESTLLYMEGAEDNRVWSPINGYIALAMLAEVTGGNSRQQILDALNISDLATLRSQIGTLWENVYCGGEYEICALANSLWISKSYDYNQETMDALAYYHYASVYQADLQEPQAAKALQTWLDNNTGGLLGNYTKNAVFPPDAVLTLASTVYLQATWSQEFNPTRNSNGIFHAPDGDQKVTFMNKKLAQMNYYWGDSFGAVDLWLKNGTRMWFFLPDADKSVDDILKDGQYLQYLGGGTENYKYMMVNLSVPKFDISSSCDLAGIFKEMGITDVFDMSAANFTAITADTPVFLTGVNQAARVIIDEQGVKAAAYIEIPGAGAAAPPEEIIDFILDRPFLFVIASIEGVPLFTGVVNEP